MADASDPQTDPVQEDAPTTDAPAAADDAPEFGDAFDRSKTFADLGLRDSVLKGTQACGFEHPSDIQAELIPHILEGKDMIGQARTGTGKTAAFGLPLLHLVESDTPMSALVLTPTRELAVQVAAELNALGKHTPLRATAIIGGESMRKQQQSVDRGDQIMVGTPGRVMDLHQRGQIHFKNIRFACLDEVDRMLDIGFRDDIRKILSTVGKDRKDEDVQTIFVSATISPDIERLSRRFMRENAEKITTVSGSLTVEMVDQKYFSVEPWDKRALLLKLLKTEKPDTTVVFCKTKATVRKVTQYLKDKGVKAQEIHGDLQQKKRNSVIKSLKSGDLDVLIASDLAARGLDVEHITHVINYDLPEDPDIYVHRIGRTARAGRRGTAWSFVTSDEGQRLTEIEKLSGAIIDHLDYPDFKPGPVPSDIREQRDRQARIDAKRQAPESRTVAVDVEELSDAQKNEMFPGGIVPAGKPRKGLGNKFKRRGR